METKKTFLSVGRGFTLIELLITIAVFSILALAVLAALSNSRQKSKDASAFSSVGSAGKVAMVCSSSLQDIANPTTCPPTCNVVCAGMSSYADITGSGWSYANFTGCALDLSASDGSFVICASNGAKGIKCTEKGCTKVGF